MLMGQLIGVMGESGSGKTTSARTLNPAHTLYVDVDGKGLSWRGWRKQYSQANKNYVRVDDPARIGQMLDYAASRPEVEVVVVDTINSAMVADEQRRKDEKGYDKWSDMAWAVWSNLDKANSLRDDLTVVMMAHSQTDADDFGRRWTRIKTSGRKLDKLVVESKMTTVLWAKRRDGEHVFITQSDDSTAKAPMDSLGEVEPNDLFAIVDKLRDYEGLPRLTPSSTGTPPKAVTSDGAAERAA